MPDVSNIVVNGTTYAINDADAVSGSGSWSPTITWAEGGTAPTVTGAACYYRRWGNFLFLHGRFQITDVGNTSGGALRITIPSAFSPVTSVAAAGMMATNYAHSLDFSMRYATAPYLEACTAAGGQISGLVQAGWHNFFAMLYID